MGDPAAVGYRAVLPGEVDCRLDGEFQLKRSGQECGGLARVASRGRAREKREESRGRGPETCWIGEVQASWNGSIRRKNDVANWGWECWPRKGSEYHIMRDCYLFLLGRPL